MSDLYISSSGSDGDRPGHRIVIHGTEYEIESIESTDDGDPRSVTLRLREEVTGWSGWWWEWGVVAVALVAWFFIVGAVWIFLHG